MKLFQLNRRAPGRPWRSVIFYWIVVAGTVRWFFRVVYGLRVRGLDSLPATGPLVYVANHQSHYDPPLVGSVVKDRPFASMARASLFDFGPMALILRLVGAVPLSRGGRGDRAAISIALVELNAGRCVLIFPEGTRSRDGALGKFNRGFLLLVKRSGATVVPVAVEGAFDIWPIHNRRPRPVGHLAVEVGAPIAAAELLKLDPDAAVEYVKRTIETMRLELRASLRRRTGGRFPAPGPGDCHYGEPADVGSPGPIKSVLMQGHFTGVAPRSG